MSDEQKQLLGLAEEYFRSQNYSNAETVLRAILVKDPDQSKANELLAYIYANNGQVDIAQQYLLKACTVVNASPEAYYYLGKIYFNKNELQSAKDHFVIAVQRGGDFFEALHDLGVTYTLLGQLEKSLEIFNQALELKSNSEELIFNIGKAYDDLRDYKKAVQYYDKLIEINPNHTGVYLNKGVALNASHLYLEGLDTFKCALRLTPNDPRAWSNMGLTLHELDRYEEALLHFDHAIKLDPSYFEAWSNKGLTLNELKNYDQAIIHFDVALALAPEFVEALTNKGLSLHYMGQYEAALYYYDSSIKIKDDHARAWLNKGYTLASLRRHVDAKICYERAIQLEPSEAGHKFNRSFECAALQNFKEAWLDYEYRWETKGFDSKRLQTSKPKWSGTKSSKRLLVWAEQGIGDQLLYASMLTQLEGYSEAILVSVEAKLVQILARSFPKIEFIAKRNNIEENIYDEHIPIGSLGMYFRNTLTDFKLSYYPYIYENIEKTNSIKFPARTNGKKLCGISWRSVNKSFGEHKSLDLIRLLPILKLSNYQFINLQYGDVDSELNDLMRDYGVNIYNVNDVDIYNDIDGLLSIISACDLVISVSNTTAHLAGALGKETLLLLPFSIGKFWYWQEFCNRESIVYPSVKIYQQERQGDWLKPVVEIKKYLENKI